MITSTSNETIKHVTQLVKSAKARRKEGVFVVEGERIAKEIPVTSLVECFVSSGYPMADRLDELFGYSVGATIVSPDVFKKMSDTQTPQGILCVCRQNGMDVKEFITSTRDRDLKILLLESIQDPGNLGTMIRSAEGAGFDAIIADRDTVDVYNPKVTRSTMGSIFRVPVIYTDDLPDTVDMLKDHSVKVYAAHLCGSHSYKEIKYPKRLAVLIGNEGSGLSDEITEKADERIRIPMQGKLESLNAAVAASILMFNVEGE